MSSRGQYVIFRKLKGGIKWDFVALLTNGQWRLFGHTVTCFRLYDLGPVFLGVEDRWSPLVLHTDWHLCHPGALKNGTIMGLLENCSVHFFQDLVWELRRERKDIEIVGEQEPSPDVGKREASSQMRNCSVNSEYLTTGCINQRHAKMIMDNWRRLQLQESWAFALVIHNSSFPSEHSSFPLPSRMLSEEEDAWKVYSPTCCQREEAGVPSSGW